MFVLLLALPIASADSAPVELLVVEEGNAVQVTVHAQEGSVALPACRAVGWERVDDDAGGYVPLPGPACGPMEDALWVGAEGLTARYAPAVGGFQVVRPVVVYGVGCRRGLPFALADCDSIEVLRGPSASVRPKAAREDN